MVFALVFFGFNPSKEMTAVPPPTNSSSSFHKLMFQPLKGNDSRAAKSCGFVAHLDLIQFQPLKGNDSRAAPQHGPRPPQNGNSFNPSKEMTAVPPGAGGKATIGGSSFNPSKEMTAVPPAPPSKHTYVTLGFNPSKEMTAVPPRYRELY